MSRILKLLFFVALVLVPTAAFATDMEYYTYGGFQPIVSAFKLIAAIFGNNSYKALFYTVVVSAASFAGLAALAKLTAGGNGSILGWTVPMLIGIAFYIALFIPTGKLVVYDSVLNKQEEVAGVPNGVVLVAGTFNLIERGLVEIISDSSSAGCYQKQAGGKGFLGLYNLSVRPLSSSVDTYLEQNLGDYIADCVTFAVNNPTSTLSIDEVRRTPVSFMASLAKASNPAIFTKYYTALEKNGSSATCAESWTAIQADINEADALSGNILSTCTEAGYNVTQPGELNACRAALKDAQDYVGLGNLGLDEFVKQLFIQQRLDNAYKSGNTTLVSNYKFLTQTSGAMKSFNEFYPMLRGVLTAVAIALIPILVIFLPTPMAGKIGTIIFGFFVWLTSWGVVDAILHGFGMEFSNMVFDNVRSGNLGLDGLYFFPDASVKALAIFGTLRMSGLMLSTALTGMLIKFGGHAVAQMASGFQSQITGAGSQTALQTENVTGQGKAMQELTTSAGSGPTSAWAAAPLTTRIAAAGARMSGEVEAFTSLSDAFGVSGATRMYGEATLGKTVDQAAKGRAYGKAGLGVSLEANVFGAVGGIGDLLGEMNAFEASKAIGGPADYLQNRAMRSEVRAITDWTNSEAVRQTAKRYNMTPSQLQQQNALFQAGKHAGEVKLAQDATGEDALGAGIMIGGASGAAQGSQGLVAGRSMGGFMQANRDKALDLLAHDAQFRSLAAAVMPADMKSNPKYFADGQVTDAGYYEFAKRVEGGRITFQDEQGVSTATVGGSGDVVRKDSDRVYSPDEARAIASEIQRFGNPNVAARIKGLAKDGHSLHGTVTRGQDGHAVDFHFTHGGGASDKDMSTSDKGRVDSYSNVTHVEDGLRSTIGNQTWRGSKGIEENFTYEKYAGRDGQLHDRYSWTDKGGHKHVVSGTDNGLIQMSVQKDGKVANVYMDPQSGQVLLENTQSGKKDVLFADRTEIQQGTSVTGSANAALGKLTSYLGIDQKSAEAVWGTLQGVASDVLPIAGAVGSTTAYMRSASATVKAETQAAEKAAEQAAERASRETASRVQQTALKTSKVLQHQSKMSNLPKTGGPAPKRYK